MGWSASAADRVERARVIEARGTVEFQGAGSSTWYLVATNQVLNDGDALRTGPRSAATLLLANRSVVPVPGLTTLRFQERRERLVVEVLKGLLYLFHRGEPADLEVTGGGVNAAVRGTEFAFEVREDGSVVTTLFDGRIALTDATGGATEMATGDVLLARPGQRAERATPVVVGDWTAVQWALDYPTILDADELGWRRTWESSEGGPSGKPSDPVPPGLEASWTAFLEGDVVGAMKAFPADREPATDAERVYLGALLLSVGSVSEAEGYLKLVGPEGLLGELAWAHRHWIDVIRRGAKPLEHEWRTATGKLSHSYALQAEARLAEARDAARQAAEQSERFYWARIRWAELEFTLGDRNTAGRVLDAGLRDFHANASGGAHSVVPPVPAPTKRRPPALRASSERENRELGRPVWYPNERVLRGFLLAARNRVREAESIFDGVLAHNGRLGSAWLGRGLCRIRRGELEAGREDLLVAAALEPQRSLYRSYLGKAFGESAGFRVPAMSDKARKELELAKRLDPGDPTPWLYSALLNQQDNRVNEGIDDLRESVVRNDNRALYRSSDGLDQDRAVRSANLANLFADAGMQELGVREATRAVNHDYANASAHLFLANSYDALRDPRQINLRYETPWYSEYLLANLLAPVGAGSLSQTVAQNEYSKLFERDRLGVVNRTTWTSNGDWIQQAAQFGQFGNVAYSLDGYYRSEQGQRRNNELEQRSLLVTAKIQAGPQDGLFLQAGISEAESGDVLQRYDPGTAIEGMRLEERQEPLAHLGWSHEWRPGISTVVLVSPWNATQTLVNPSNAVPWVVLNSAGNVEVGQFSTVPLENYRSRLTGVAVEVQQLWKADRHAVVAGARYQHGGFDTTARLNVDDFAPDAPTHSATDPELERASVYAYDHWSLARGVLLTMGVSYDRLTQPRNFRTAPLTEGTESMERVLPKLGLTVTPWKGGTLRAAWARSLGGVSFDQSFRLEPVQVAGFTQVYRGLMPESLVGSVAGQEMETIGVAWDQVFPTRTWLTVSAERISSEASREIGGYVYRQSGFETVSAFRQELDFTEHALAMTVGQLVGRDLALTMRYRVAEATLDREFLGLPADADFVGDERSVLNQLTLGARYQRPEGFFGSWESTWSHQSNSGDAAWMEGDSFWRHDVWVGWRFLRRKAEVAVGMLNLTDEDYRLYPLNYFGETYRERTVAVTGRFAF